MLRPWTAFAFILGILWCFGSVSADHRHRDDDDRHDDAYSDVAQRMREMRRRFDSLPEGNMDQEFARFKQWVRNFLSRSFAFPEGPHLRQLDSSIDHLMRVPSRELQGSMQELLTSLERTANSAQASNFARNVNNHLIGGSTTSGRNNLRSEKIFSAIPGSFTFDEADRKCQSQFRGHLAVVSGPSEAQAAWRKVALHRSSQQYFYIGLKTLPEIFSRIRPSLMNWLGASSESSRAKCMAVDANVFNRTRLFPCNQRIGALCEHFNVQSSFTKGTRKGFVYYKTLVSKASAQQKCAAIGGDLATIKNYEEQKVAYNHITNEGNVNAFMGVHREPNGIWRWADGTAMTLKLFGHYRVTPNDRCAVMEGKIPLSKHGATWRAVSCSSRQATLCQVKLVSDIMVRLTQRFATEKYFVVRSGSLSQTEARAKCSHGLAKIRTEKHFLAAVLQTNKVNNAVYIGLSDRQKPGQFIWDDGSVLESEMQDRLTGFSARRDSARCVIMDVHGRWLIVSCDYKASALCEVPYLKVANKKGEDTPHAVQMDVRFNIQIEEVTRTPQMREAFMKSVESSIARVIGVSAKNVVVSKLTSGSTIATFRLWPEGDYRKAVAEIKRAVSSNSVVLTFNGRLVHTTKLQNFNVKSNMCIYDMPYHSSRKLMFCGIGLAILIICCSLIGLSVFFKKRKIVVSRVDSEITVQKTDEIKNGPIPCEQLPNYEEATRPPPYVPPPHFTSPPPPYAPPERSPTDVST